MTAIRSHCASSHLTRFVKDAIGILERIDRENSIHDVCLHVLQVKPWLLEVANTIRISPVIVNNGSC